MKIFSLLKMPMPFTLSLLIGLAMVAQAELVDLAVIDAENMKKTPEGWEALATIYLPGKQGYGIEAEKASSVLTQPGDFRIVKGDEASGGAFLFSPLALTIELEVIKKGAYSFNLRMRNNKDFVSPSSLNKFTDKKASPSMPAITVDGKKIL